MAKNMIRRSFPRGGVRTSLPVTIYRRKASNEFSPADIAGLAHWWDANDAASLSITGSPAGVQTWTSKAGARTVASQTTPENRPTTTTVNGKTALLFDGSNDGFNFTGTARTDETWIIAAAQTADQSGTRALVNDGTAGDGINIAKGGSRLLDTSWGNGTDGVGRLRASYAANAATPYGPAVVSVVRSTAAGGFVFIDGTQRISAVNGSSSFTTSGSITIQRIGYYNSTTFPLQGWIGEILLYDRALSASDRLQAERYLGNKWGITVA
jgi:hypothetical protein